MDKIQPEKVLTPVPVAASKPLLTNKSTDGSFITSSSAAVKTTLVASATIILMNAAAYYLEYEITATLIVTMTGVTLAISAVAYVIFKGEGFRNTITALYNKSTASPKEAPKLETEKSKVTTAETPKEEVKETPKEAPKEETKLETEESKVTTAETPKEEVKEAPKEESKEVPKEEPKLESEESKVTTSETPKEESKEETKTDAAPKIEAKVESSLFPLSDKPELGMKYMKKLNDEGTRFVYFNEIKNDQPFGPAIEKGYNGTFRFSFNEGGVRHGHTERIRDKNVIYFTYPATDETDYFEIQNPKSTSSMPAGDIDHAPFKEKVRKKLSDQGHVISEEANECLKDGIRFVEFKQIKDDKGNAFRHGPAKEITLSNLNESSFVYERGTKTQ